MYKKKACNICHVGTWSEERGLLHLCWSAEDMDYCSKVYGLARHFCQLAPTQLGPDARQNPAKGTEKHSKLLNSVFNPKPNTLATQAKKTAHPNPESH